MLHHKPRWHSLSDPEFRGSGVLPSYAELMQWEGVPDRLDMVETGTVVGLPEGIVSLSKKHLSDDDLVKEYEDLIPSYEYNLHADTTVLFNPYPVLLEILARHVLYGTNVLPPDWAD